MEITIQSIDQRNEYAQKIYSHLKEDDVDIELFIQKIIEDATKINYYEGMCYGYIHLALRYFVLESKVEASSYLIKIEELIYHHKLNDNIRLKLYNAYVVYYVEVLGDLKSGADYAQKGILLAEKMNNKRMLMRLKSNLGAINSQLGFFEAGKELFEVAIDYYELIQDEQQLMYSYNNLGEVCFELGDINRALLLYTKAYEMAKKNDEISVVQDSAVGLSRISCYNKNYEEAIAMLQNTITYSRRSKSKKYQVEASLELVSVFIELQRFGEALDLLGKFEKDLHSIENKKNKMKYYELKEETCHQLGQYEMAYDALKQHMDLYKEVNNLMAEKAVNDVMAREYARSIRRLETIATVGRELTMHSNVDEVLLEVKEILSELMDINGIGIGEIIGDNIEYNHYITGETKIKPQRMKIDDPSSLASWCVKNNREVKINDIDKEYSLYIKDIIRMDTDNSNLSQDEQIKMKESQKVNSVLYAPLIVKNEIIGVFTIQSNKVNAYMTEEFELFKIIASYVAIAFKNVNQTKADVLAYAESLCKEVEAMAIKFENELIKVTTSVGVTYKTYDAQLTFKELYHLADRALYQAKELGRNRVVYS